VSVRITGRRAIEAAETLGLRLWAYADPTSDGGPVDLAEAKDIARSDPSLITLVEGDLEAWFARNGEQHAVYRRLLKIETSGHSPDLRRLASDERQSMHTALASGDLVRVALAVASANQLFDGWGLERARAASKR